MKRMRNNCFELNKKSNTKLPQAKIGKHEYRKLLSMCQLFYEIYAYLFLSDKELCHVSSTKNNIANYLHNF